MSLTANEFGHTLVNFDRGVINDQLHLICDNGLVTWRISTEGLRSSHNSLFVLFLLLVVPGCECCMPVLSRYLNDKKVKLEIMLKDGKYN